jgi:hypothetical protein
MTIINHRSLHHVIKLTTRSINAATVISVDWTVRLVCKAT